MNDGYSGMRLWDRNRDDVQISPYNMWGSGPRYLYQDGMYDRMDSYGYGGRRLRPYSPYYGGRYNNNYNNGYYNNGYYNNGYGYNGYGGYGYNNYYRGPYRNDYYGGNRYYNNGYYRNPYYAEDGGYYGGRYR